MMPSKPEVPIPLDITASAINTLRMTLSQVTSESGSRDNQFKRPPKENSMATDTPPLTLHFDHIVLYRKLLARLYQSLHDLYRKHKHPTSAQFVLQTIAHLGRLTPHVSILASSASDIVYALRKCTFEYLSSKENRASLKRAARDLRKQTKCIVASFKYLAVNTQRTTDEMNNICREHELVRTNRARSCMHLEDRLRIIHKGLRTTNTTLYRLTNVLGIARQERTYARARLFFLKFLATVCPPLRVKMGYAIRKATDEVPIANATISRISRDCEWMRDRRQRLLNQFLSFSSERKKERAAMAIEEQQIEETLGVVCRMAILRTQLYEAVELWGKVENTIAIICDNLEEVQDVGVELWHTVSVISRLYVVDHAESVRKMLKNIELQPGASSDDETEVKTRSM